MDFSLAEDEQALRDLASQIIADNVTHASMRDLSASGERIDRGTWKKLADAGVISAVMPVAIAGNDLGGSGLGAVAVGALLEVVGEHAAPLPVLSTVAMAAGPIARFAGADFDADLLRRVMTGDTLIACAPRAVVKASPARAGHGGWTLTGHASLVLDGLDADNLLVPTSDGWMVVDLSQPGVAREPMAMTSQRPLAHITLSDVPVDTTGHLDADSEDIRRHIEQHTDSALASSTLGLCTGAIRLMADHAQQRHQFDRPIASFQAVSQRAGNAFIDKLAVELTAHQAAWRLDAGLDAEREIAIARWWAAEGSYRIIHAASHIHGGIGVDYDYPLHRYVLLARQLELIFGNSEQQLEILGKSLRSS